MVRGATQVREGSEGLGLEMGQMGYRGVTEVRGIRRATEGSEGSERLQRSDGLPRGYRG